jgi:hypothetical protein
LGKELIGAASIADVQWVGLRCRVVVEPANAPVTVDIRTKVGDRASSVTAPKLHTPLRLIVFEPFRGHWPNDIMPKVL